MERKVYYSSAKKKKSQYDCIDEDVDIGSQQSGGIFSTPKSNKIINGRNAATSTKITKGARIH